MKKLSILVFLLFSVLSNINADNSSLSIEQDICKTSFSEEGCTAYEITLDGHCKIVIDVCSNGVSGFGEVLGHKVVNLNFKDNGKGMWRLMQKNDAIGFKIYVNKKNGEMWYKLGWRRGLDDRKFDWTERRRL